jgi:hypothetical protein
MKLCKDCRWAQPPTNERKEWTCGHTDALFPDVSYVTGELLAHPLSCETERRLGTCGHWAKNWEPKPEVGFV